MVRERIKQKVYENYGQDGEGFCVFDIFVDDHGVLEDARIIPEKTDASGHLQEIAIKSLREASPFPPF